MNDDIWPKIVCGALKLPWVFQHGLGRREPRRLQKHFLTPPFEAHVVVIGQAIKAMNHIAFFQKASGEMKADKAGGPGDQNTLHPLDVAQVRLGRNSFAVSRDANGKTWGAIG